MTADRYARKVESALRDLPWPQRRDLIAELRQHLAELPPETDIEARLGHPERYAADLRTAAGLRRQRGAGAFLRARRPRTFVLTAIALALVGVVVAGVLWVDSYQPLVRGKAVLWPPGAKQGIGEQAMEVKFRQGKPFDAGVSIVNSGRFTVRVTGVEPWNPLPGPTRPYLAGPLPSSTAGFRRPSVPFHPFDLPPGDVAFVAFRGTYHARCHPVSDGGTGWGIGGYEIQYSFLWNPGHADLLLPEPLFVDSPPGEDCGGY